MSGCVLTDVFLTDGAVLTTSVSYSPILLIRDGLYVSRITWQPVGAAP